MASIERPLAGDPLVLRLGAEMARASEGDLLARHGRSARTLLKDGPLRVTLITLAPGGSIAEHRAEGPITVQPIHGRIRFRVGETDYDLAPGELLGLRAGVPHSVASDGGGAFLLTVALADGGAGS